MKKKRKQSREEFTTSEDFIETLMRMLQRANHQATELEQEVAVFKQALERIRYSAEQSSQWPPHRRDASLEGIAKVANKALAVRVKPIDHEDGLEDGLDDCLDNTP